MEKPVVIENYNPNWSKEYEQEKKKIMGVLKRNNICIEHIGSTSVIGLGAKPILDIMVGVNNLEEVDKFIEPLKQIGCCRGFAGGCNIPYWKPSFLCNQHTLAQ